MQVSLPNLWPRTSASAAIVRGADADLDKTVGHLLYIPPVIRRTHVRPTIKPSKPTRTGAVTNHPSRFLAAVVEPQSDDWGDGLDILEHWQARSTKVQVKPDLTKRLITTNRSPDIPFEQSINPYKGCEHGCIYCFARPTHAYLDLSPGLDFETYIFYKTNVREHLLRELTRPSYLISPSPWAPIRPHQPIERASHHTNCFELALQTRHQSVSSPRVCKYCEI